MQRWNFKTMSYISANGKRTYTAHGSSKSEAPKKLFEP
jgi:hypothetical protein